MAKRLSPALLLVCVLAGCAGPAAPDPPSLRFEATIADGLTAQPQDGRLLILIGRRSEEEPRHSIDPEDVDTPAVLGRDVKGLAPGMTAVVDGGADVFPYERLSQLPKGDYVVQAVLDVNRALKLIDAPGNLRSDPLDVSLDPARGGVVKLELRTGREEKLPNETDHVRFVELRSELLSKFNGRPTTLKAGVILPRDFDKDPDRRYPLRVEIGGYGTRYTEVLDMMDDCVGASGGRGWRTGAAIRAAAPGRRRPLRRSVSGQFRQQRPLRRRPDAGAYPLRREEVSLHRRAVRPRAGRRLDGWLGVAGVAGLLSRLLQRRLVARPRPGRFPGV